jgi:hypothetical protein
MDVFSHAIAGASVGSVFGNPWLGAFISITPDLVLGPYRKSAPPQLYNMTHSVLMTSAVGLSIWIVFATPVVLLALYSHLILDIPTHGKEWAPTLFYPLSEKRYGCGEEWEWFNKSWFIGLAITTVWCVLCYMLTSFTGAIR